MFRLLAGARSPTGAILATEADWELNAVSRQRAGLPELSQRVAQCPAGLPNLAQTRMCRFPASGSSWESLARSGVTMDNSGRWRRILNSRAPGGLNISTAQSRQGSAGPNPKRPVTQNEIHYRGTATFTPCSERGPLRHLAHADVCRIELSFAPTFPKLTQINAHAPQSGFENKDRFLFRCCDSCPESGDSLFEKTDAVLKSVLCFCDVSL